MKRKTGSASYGIDFDYIEPERKRWFYWHRFPLLPIFDRSKGDEYNSPGFSFSWLNLRIWSLDTFAFVAEFHVEGIGIFLRFQLPYLNIYLWLMPFPERWLHKLSRSPLVRMTPQQSSEEFSKE